MDAVVAVFFEARNEAEERTEYQKYFPTLPRVFTAR
jgi:hypothetical protein